MVKVKPNTFYRDFDGRKIYIDSIYGSTRPFRGKTNINSCTYNNNYSSSGEPAAYRDNHRLKELYY